MSFVNRVNIFSYSDEEGTSAFDIKSKVEQETIDQRAEILGDIVSEITLAKLDKEIGTKIDLVIDKQSDEHEYLLSARKLNWAPDIDGEIYVNDKEIKEELQFGKVYKAKITERSGDKLLATICST